MIGLTASPPPSPAAWIRRVDIRSRHCRLAMKDAFYQPNRWMEALLYEAEMNGLLETSLTNASDAGDAVGGKWCTVRLLVPTQLRP